jgi:hypothetical protein
MEALEGSRESLAAAQQMNTKVRDLQTETVFPMQPNSKLQLLHSIRCWEVTP